MRNCEDLKNAVVIQTVKDYRKNMKKLQKNPTDEEAQQLVKECREFLLSDRVNFFTKVDYVILLQRIDAEFNIGRRVSQMYFTSSPEDRFFEWQMKQVPGFDRTRVDPEDEKSESNIRNPTIEKIIIET